MIMTKRNGYICIKHQVTRLIIIWPPFFICILPAANFWSITVYDALNSSGLDNGQAYPSIGSLDDLKYNDDGSIDLFFAPELPEGVPETNWLKTVPGKGWFTLLRLYSPTEAFFDQTWRPDDFNKLVPGRN